MAKLRKYEAASRFADDADALYWLGRGYYFWFAGKPLHSSFVSGWMVGVFLRATRGGQLTRAKIRGEWLKDAMDRDVARMEAAYPQYKLPPIQESAP